jgi:hypothetical protein
MGSSESGPVRPDPEEGDEPWPDRCEPLLELARPTPDLVRAQLVRPRRRSGDEVRHAEFPIEQRGVLEGRQEAVGESGRVQRLPEPVARPSEVMPDGARPEPRVDAHEDDVEVRPEHVGDRSAARGLEVGLRGVQALSQSRVRSGHHERDVVI